LPEQDKSSDPEVRVLKSYPAFTIETCNENGSRCTIQARRNKTSLFRCGKSKTQNDDEDNQDRGNRRNPDRRGARLF
jgi:hypothetical protein